MPNDILMEYRCDVCGLHYNDKMLAEKCYKWCSVHNSCNLEITKHSVEREKRGKKTDGN